jgi:hypothetical protein
MTFPASINGIPPMLVISSYCASLDLDDDQTNLRSDENEITLTLVGSAGLNCHPRSAVKRVPMRGKFRAFLIQEPFAQTVILSIWSGRKSGGTNFSHVAILKGNRILGLSELSGPVFSIKLGSVGTMMLAWPAPSRSEHLAGIFLKRFELSSLGLVSNPQIQVWLYRITFIDLVGLCIREIRCLHPPVRETESCSCWVIAVRFF